MNKSLYFQHDYNSANDHKILFLRQQFGIEGYGIFWYIIEQLAQSGGTLPTKIIPVLAMQIQTTPDKVKAVIYNYDLFTIDNEEFFSIRLKQQLEFRQQLSNAGTAGALKRWGNSSKNGLPNSPANAKGKERKGKKEKEMVFPSVLIATDEQYWEGILMRFKHLKPTEILTSWEGWYVNKFEWRKKELSEMRLSFETWLKDPHQRKKASNPNPYKIQ